MSAFNRIKTTQAAAYLIGLHGNRMTRLRLLKLLYIADRECLAETLRPITFDRAVAMENGPVLSQTFDLIKGSSFSSALWAKYIQPDGPRDLRLVIPASMESLSRYEIEKLGEVAARFESDDDYAVADYTHEYPEWIKNRPSKGRQNPIPFDDRVEAVGIQAEARQHIVDSYKEDEAFAELLREA